MKLEDLMQKHMVVLEKLAVVFERQNDELNGQVKNLVNQLKSLSDEYNKMHEEIMKRNAIIDKFDNDDFASKLANLIADNKADKQNINMIVDRCYSLLSPEESKS